MTITKTAWAVLAAGGLLAATAGCGSTRTTSNGSTWATSRPSPEVANSAQTGPVTWITDGDTLHVDMAGKNVKVRILGINAPELAHDGNPEQCGGTAARAALARLLDGKTVVLTRDPGEAKTDQYGRLLRYVHTDGQDVGLVMIQQGRASEYHPRSSHPEALTSRYVTAQRAAQHARAGQWATCTPDQERKQ